MTTYKMKYTRKCKSILKHKDWKKRMVDWIMECESFDRDEFMMEMVKCKKEVKK